MDEVKQETGPWYHGTKADLGVGDHITVGWASNVGSRKVLSWVYFTGTLDAAAWGAELSDGDGQGKIYVVEPTGPFENDPNLTDKKFPGNPTRSFRSRDPLLIIGEVEDWQGHSPEQIKAMQESIARIVAQGIEPID